MPGPPCAPEFNPGQPAQSGEAEVGLADAEVEHLLDITLAEQDADEPLRVPLIGVRKQHLARMGETLAAL